MVDLLDFEATVMVAHERQGDEDVVVHRRTRPTSRFQSQTVLEEGRKMSLERLARFSAGRTGSMCSHLGRRGPSLASVLGRWTGERLAVGLNIRKEELTLVNGQIKKGGVLRYKHSVEPVSGQRLRGSAFHVFNICC